MIVTFPNERIKTTLFAAAMALLSPTSSALADDNVILLVHGFGPLANPVAKIATGANGLNCAGYWGSMKSYLQSKGRQVYTVGYYGGNVECDYSVKWVANNSIETSIERLGFEFSKFIEETFPNQKLDVVAHSMGGLVVRDSIDDQPDAGKIERVITLGTPHEGAKLAQFFSGTGVCQLFQSKQCRDMHPSSNFLRRLEHNPQSFLQTTQWSMISSPTDEVVGPGTAHLMRQGNALHPAPRRRKYSETDRTTNLSCIGPGRVAHGDLSLNKTVKRCTSPNSKRPTPADLVWQELSRAVSP